MFVTSRDTRSSRKKRTHCSTGNAKTGDQDVLLKSATKRQLAIWYKPFIIFVKIAVWGEMHSANKFCAGLKTPVERHFKSNHKDLEQSSTTVLLKGKEFII
jgi:hypothetical protein